MGLASDLYNDTDLQAQAVTPPPQPEATPNLSAASLYGSPESQKEDQLKFVMDETISESPDKSARALQIQSRTGIPKKFIDDNFDELDKAAKQADFNSREFIKTSPKVAEWLLKNPDYAPLLREDISTIGGLEALIDGPKRFFAGGNDTWGAVLSKMVDTAGHGLNRSFVAGGDAQIATWRNAPIEAAKVHASSLSNMIGHALGFVALGGKMPLNDVNKIINQAFPPIQYSAEATEAIRSDPRFVSAMDRAKFHTESMQELSPDVGEFSAKDIVFSGGSSFIQNFLPLIATGVVGGGVVGGTTVFTTQVFQDSVAEALAEGKTLEQAADYGVWKIMAEGIPESIPFSAAFKPMKGFWAKTLNVAVTESAEEMLTEVADIGREVLKLDEDLSLKDAMNRVLKAGVVGAVTGGGMGSIGGTKDLANQYQAKRQAKLQENFFKALGENASNSTLREKLPDSYQAIIADLTKDGPVENLYAPIEFFQKHFEEQGINPRQLAMELGIERQYDEAVNTGDKISIPTAVYAKNIAPTDSNTAFAKELAFGPDQMSSRETDEFLKSQKEAETNEPDPFDASLQEAMAPVREQIGKIYPSDTADRNVAIAEAQLRTLAKNMNMDPREVVKQSGLTVQEGIEGGKATLNQASMQTETPEFKNWFGDSKVVDENGKPLVVYHGTDKAFTKISMKKGAQGVFWVTSDKSAIDSGDVGASGKGKIMELYVSMKNPAGWKEYDQLSLGEIKGRGFDGVILPDKDGTFNAIVFDNKQVKSATKNRGTFDPNDPNILKQEGSEITRGSISLTDTGSIINLFKSKNLSTLLHEFGHKFLFDLIKFGQMETAPQQMKDDIAKALKWLDLESLEQLDIARFEPGTKEHARAIEAHEKWARGFEAYLKEGKAPSTSLRRVFATIKAWMLAVYDALKQGSLDVDLSPEIRSVFDRLLATKEEIDAARSDASHVPIGTTAVDAGMTDIEFAAYRTTMEDANREAQEEIDAKIMEEYKRTLTDLWKEERAKIKTEVETEVDAMPVYSAIKKAQENGILINRDAARAVSPELYKRLPRTLTAENGIPPDMAAELLGFQSGSELVRSIAGAEKRETLVNRETDLRMNQRFGNMLTDGTIVEEAKKALANDIRAKTISMEIKALHKKAREVAPFVKAKEKAEAEQDRAGRDMYRGLVPKLSDVREHARQVIAGKPIREIQPISYYNIARQSSRAAMESIRKGDYLVAAYHKGRELLNLELYREAVKAKDLVDVSLDKLGKAFVSDIKQSKTRNMDMVNAARAILASHGIGRAEESPSSYLEKVRQYDPETYENLRPLFEPALRTMTPYKNMTVEEFIGMRDSVLALMNQSRRSKQIEIDGKLMDREKVVGELVNRIGTFSKKQLSGYNRTRTKWEKTQAGILGARAVLRRVEHWVDAMDGGNPDGVFRRYLLNPVVDAVNDYRDAKRDMMTKYLAIVRQVEGGLTREKIDAPELGFQFNGKVELLHAILHTGNESNLRKLVVGYKLGEVLEDGTLNTARWDTFVNRMQEEGILTKADYDFAQGVWDMMEEMKPKAQEANHRMYGYYFDEVTANEFTNRFGTYRGGYIPAVVDQDVVTDAAVRKDREELLHGQNSFAFPTTGRGATMKRIDSYAKPLQLDMRTIPAHIDWAMRFAYIEPAVKDVGRVVINRDFRDAMDALDPAASRHMLMPWLQRSAKQLTSTPGMLPWMDKVWREVRTRTGMQIMVTNVINTLQQFTGLSIAMTKVRAGSMRTAFVQYLTNHKEVNETISEKSAFMRNRIFTSHVEIQQTIDDLLLNPSKYEKARDFAMKHGYFMQMGTQSIVDKITWMAGYNEGIRDGMNEKDAVRHADSVVRETQGSFAPEDISRFEASTPFVRAFSMFYNYFNMQANLLGTEFANIATNKLGLRKGAGRALYLYVFGFLIPAYVGDTLIRALISGQPDDDDDGYLDDYLSAFFNSQVRAVSAMVPIAGPTVMAGINAWNDKWYDDRITTSPAVSMIESSVRAPYTVYKAIADDGSQKRAVQDTLSAIGLLTGFPAGALGRPLGYLADVSQGRAEPENALDVARGLVSGRDVNRDQ